MMKQNNTEPVTQHTSLGSAETKHCQAFVGGLFIHPW